MSTFGGIETALSGLQAQQLLAETATTNVTNANTPGYSRQQVDLAANPSLPPPSLNATGPGQIGTGVQVLAINRLADSLVSSSLRSAVSQQSAANVQQDTTTQIQSVFNELSGNGISSQLSQFWNSWQNVANAPSDLGARTALLGNAQQLATTLQSDSTQLQNLQTGLDQQVVQQVSQIKSLASQVANLNGQIVTIQATGQQPNNLLDQRDQVLSKMAGLAQIGVASQTDGSVRVTLNGIPLVNETNASALTTSAGPNGTHQIVAANGTVLSPTGGTLGGLLSMRDGQIPSTQSTLNTWAQRLISAVNAVHSGQDPSTGTTTNVYDLVTPGTPVQRPFFVGTDASNIAVNSSLVQNPSLIAASQTANGTGDGSNALAIANIQNDPTAGGAPSGSPTIDSQYTAFATSIGTAAANAQSNASNQNLVVSNLQQVQSQLSGVSLDQEAASLVTFQSAYQAAARSLTVFDNMLNTLINNTGLVGGG